jgi:hypothetical protein
MGRIDAFEQLHEIGRAPQVAEKHHSIQKQPEV